MNRAVEIAGFLAQHGWGEAEHFPFAADFSPRRYARLVKQDNERAVLMDADPNQKTPEFVEFDLYLDQLGFSVPKIFAADPEHGIVLMEDLGTGNLGSLIDRQTPAEPLLRRAVDVLVHLHKVFKRDDARALDLPIYGGALFASQAELFLDIYAPYRRGREGSHEEYEEFRSLWKELLRDVDRWPQSLLLRDFMPDNLMDLPKRLEWKNIGLLDFQDMGVGPIAYDLASLCEVVRRKGSDALLDDMIAYYAKQSATTLAVSDLRRMTRILSAQRHTRILGILARQIKAGRTEKQVFLNHVEVYLSSLLGGEEFRALRQWMIRSELLRA